MSLIKLKVDLAQKVSTYWIFFPVYYNVTIIVKLIVSDIDFVILLY